MSDFAPRRRRRWIAPLVALVVVLALAGYTVLTLVGTPPTATASVKLPAIPAGAAYAYPQGAGSESALNVSGADGFSTANGTIGSSGGDSALPIASISKLIAALVILNKAPLGTSDAGPTLTFSKADHALYDKYYVLGATVTQMDTNSTMSERDALSVMLLASACNYTEAVTDWAFGSQGAYLSAAKNWLAANKLTGTTLVESTGLDDRNTSTPTDLLTLGRLALANPALASIVNQRLADVDAVGSVTNTNDLIGTDGVNGLKTGTLDAGSDLLFSSALTVQGLDKPLSVVGVVLEGASRGSVDSNVRAMLGSITAAFHVIQVVKTRHVVGKYTTPWGDNANVVTEEGASIASWSNTPITSTVVTKRVSAAKAGTVVGSITYRSGTQKVVVPLVLDDAIAGPDWSWRITHPAAVLGG